MSDLHKTIFALALKHTSAPAAEPMPTEKAWEAAIDAHAQQYAGGRDDLLHELTSSIGWRERVSACVLKTARAFDAFAAERVAEIARSTREVERELRPTPSAPSDAPEPKQHWLDNLRPMSEAFPPDTLAALAKRVEVWEVRLAAERGLLSGLGDLVDGLAKRVEAVEASLAVLLAPYDEKQKGVPVAGSIAELRASIDAAKSVELHRIAQLDALLEVTRANVGRLAERVTEMRAGK